MKILVIGWYGTETIGDRGIFAGLLSFFNKTFNSFEVRLGSLFPFFSERTLNEDYTFLKESLSRHLVLDIANTMNPKELDESIKWADLVVMGGGPLMDLEPLFMVEYAFKKAKKLNKKTAIIGCGVGPLFHKKYQKAVLSITQNSDLTILRDNSSKTYLEGIYSSFKREFNSASVLTSYDPAVEISHLFKKRFSPKKQDYIAINLRDFPQEYSKTGDVSVNDQLRQFVKEVCTKYTNKEIRLIPMHYFHVGNDDRHFLNDIAQEIKQDNLVVQNENLSLEETLRVFQEADFNIGMRFHSVVLQTIVSGKNYVLDYTEPRKGKIYGFLNDIDNFEFYKNRYISLQSEKVTSTILDDDNSLQFTYNEADLEKRLLTYQNSLKASFND